MKVAFISDIHANLEALESVLKKIDKLETKKIFCLGDVVGYGANPNECLDIIRKRKIPSVVGNHEFAVSNQDTSRFNIYAAQAVLWTIDSLKENNLHFIKGFPEKLEIKLENKKILLVHGSPRKPIWEYIYPADVDEDFVNNLDYDAVAMGHTHVPFVERVKDKLVFNPGSVGQPRDSNPKASFAVLDSEKLEVEIVRVEYDIDKAAKKIIKAGLPEFLAQRLYSGI